MGRTPESMGEETVQSIREEGVASVEPESVMEVGTESNTREAAVSGSVSVTVRATDSGVEVRTMSVMGRMVGDDCPAALTVSMTGGAGEPCEGEWPESLGGGGVGGGGLGGGGGGAISLTQGEVESNCCGWESTTGGVGESLVEGGHVESSAISNWMEMSECVLTDGGGSVEMLQSVMGTGEGAGDGERPSCIGGAGDSSGAVVGAEVA